MPYLSDGSRCPFLYPKFLVEKPAHLPLCLLLLLWFLKYTISCLDPKNSARVCQHFCFIINLFYNGLYGPNCFLRASVPLFLRKPVHSHLWFFSVKGGGGGQVWTLSPPLCLWIHRGYLIFFKIPNIFYRVCWIFMSTQHEWKFQCF